MKTEIPFQIRLTREDRRRLDEIAAAARRTRGGIVKFMIHQAYERMREAQERELFAQTTPARRTVAPPVQDALT